METPCEQGQVVVLNKLRLILQPLGGFLTDSSTLCADVDECEETTDNSCDKHARCINTEGSYTCKCLKGYQSTAVNSTAFAGQCIGE